MNSQDRLAHCWAIQDCGNCLQSNNGCGWCPSSSTCVPADNLLSPVSNEHVCPLRSERFELRTRALGCHCSIITLLSVIVTVFATLATVAVLYGIGIAIKRVDHTFGFGSRHGVEVKLEDDGSRIEGDWRRRGTWSERLLSLFRSSSYRPTPSDQERATERTRLIQ